MHRFSSSSIFGIFFIFIILLSPLVASSSAQAMVCTSGPPICKAAPGDHICSNDATKQCHADADCVGPGTCIGGVLGIAGTVTANPNSISSVVLTGSTNVTLTVSSLPNANVTFRVVQTSAASDAQATVLATDSLGGTCTIPVSFRNRSLGAANNELICPMAGPAGGAYELDAVSSPSSPAGTTACSSHLATCSDVLPSGYDFLPDSRILSIRSPITSPGSQVVQMELASTRSNCPCLRFMFSRSSDLGTTFSAFADVTTWSTPPSLLQPDFIRLGGTGQWSDVRVVAAQSLNPVPTLGSWGLVLVSVLLLTTSSVLLMRRRRAFDAATEAKG